MDNRKSITDFVRKAYFVYFGIKLRDQDKQWAPHVVCKWNQTINGIWDTNGLEGTYNHVDD